MRLPRVPALISLLGVCFCTSLLAGQDGRARRHNADPTWESVAQHLPDLATAPAPALEAQGDLLRVRRFPEDALDFYAGARKQVGDSAVLLNKIGMAHLDLRHLVLAQAYFLEALKLNPRNPHVWNNLGAAEYLQGRYSEAVSDYRKAVKLEFGNAIFHANLSTAYFEWRNDKASLREAEEALRLDPLVFQQISHPAAANPLAVEDHMRFAMTLAALYARRRQEAEMLRELATVAAEGGSVAWLLASDRDLAAYKNDPRVAGLVGQPTKMGHGTALVATGGVPADAAGVP